MNPTVGQRGGRTRSQRMRAPVALAAALGALAVALHVRDPHRSTWVVCPWQVVTGTDCPGCGGLRAVSDLTHLRIIDAASTNLAFVTSLPFAGMIFGRWVHESWTGGQRNVDRRHAATVSVVAGVLVVAWWIVRNLPGLEWLRA